MRVAAITPNYPPRSRVGAWLATHELMRHLVQRGHEVTAFSCMDRSPAYDVDGVHVETVLRGRDHAFEIAAWSEVVVSHFGDKSVIDSEPSGAEVAEAVGRPSVRMGHGGGPYGPGARCDLAVFNSMSLREAWGWDGPSLVVHPFTDPAEFATTPGDRITLVNLAEHKGGDLFERIAREMDDRPFLAVKGGYGSQQNVPHPNVETIGPTRDMRDDVYARTRVLLMPSMYETWGMVGVEAMASGIPVIATPTPGLRESLGDAGIFVDYDDNRGWVNAIRRLDDPDEYALASERALKRSAELAADDGRDRFCGALEALCS